VISGNLSRIVSDGVVMAGMVSNALLCDQGRPLNVLPEVGLTLNSFLGQ